MLTVLYSSSRISGPSVDFAVTFSLPGIPSSSCSTCAKFCKLRMTRSSRAHFHCHSSLDLLIYHAAVKKAQSHKTFISAWSQSFLRQHLPFTRAVWSNDVLREESWRKHLPEQVQTSWWTSRRVFPCRLRLFLPFPGQNPAEEWNAPSLWHPAPGQP